MPVVLMQKNFSTDALPDLVEPPRWPGVVQGNKNPPKIPKPSGRRRKTKTITELSDAINARRENLKLRTENLELLSRKEISEQSKRQIQVHPPDITFQEYKLKQNIRERPMSEIAIPSEWGRRKWDVAPVEGPFNLPDLVKKRANSGRLCDDVIVPDGGNAAPAEDLTKRIVEKQPLKPKSHPPPPEIFRPRELPVPPSRPPIRRQRLRPIQRPRSAQPVADYKDFDFMDGVFRPRTEMTQGRLEKYQMDIVAGATLSEPGWGDRTIDKRFLEDAARELVYFDTVKVRIWQHNICNNNTMHISFYRM